MIDEKKNTRPGLRPVRTAGDEGAPVGPDPHHAMQDEGGPLDLNRDPPTKGDIAATARWLESRRAEAQAEMTRRVERHSGALRVSNDHLVLIRSEIARLRTEMGKGFDATRRDATCLHREIRNRRGRIRWLLAALAGFLLGLVLSGDGLLDWIQRLLGAG